MSWKYPHENNFKWKNMANVILLHLCDPQKNLASFFQFFGPFLGIYPPCLWLYLKKFLAKHFKIIKYQCTIVTLTRWDWFWVKKFFFLLVTVQEHCVPKWPLISFDLLLRRRDRDLGRLRGVGLILSLTCGSSMFKFGSFISFYLWCLSF